MDKYTISYSPVVTSENRFLGLHLTVDSDESGHGNLDAAIGGLAGFIAAVPGRVLLSHRGFDLETLSARALPQNLVLVTPAADLVNWQTRDRIRRAHLTSGIRLAVQGRSDTPLPRDMIPMFDCALIREADDRRRRQDPDAQTAYRRIPYITIGDETQDAVESAFFAGAIAAVGWPRGITEQPSLARPAQPPQIAASRFMAMASRGATLTDMEGALSLAPAVNERLMKLLPALERSSAPPATFEDAYRSLGKDGLVRILSILLLTSSRDYKALALIHASVVRAVYLSTICDQDRRHDVFVAGAMSLADRITNTNLGKLLDLVHANANVRAMLLSDDKMYRQRLALLEALESGDGAAGNAALAKLNITCQQSNTTLIRALEIANAVIKVFQPT